MKTKDIILLSVSIMVIIGAGVFVYFMLFPPTATNTPNETSNKSQTQTITGKIDQETLNKVNSLKDYGKADLTNIGRVNPFGSLK